MKSTCGILLNGERILLTRLSNDTDWVLPGGVCGEDESDYDSIKRLMMSNLNIEIHHLHTIRSFEKKDLVITPLVIEYVSGEVELIKYTDCKFVDKSESKKIRIHLLYRPIVKAFFDSYSILLKK